jgi:hypothetical protein
MRDSFMKLRRLVSLSVEIKRGSGSYSFGIIGIRSLFADYLLARKLRGKNLRT